jgi:cytochrome c oxidase subunit 4
MATESHDDHQVNYMFIFWWLLALTILEVIAGMPQTSMQYPPALKNFFLVGMALVKAALVALYFMHLRFDRKALSFIAFIPLVLCVFVVLMVMPDF